MATSHERVSCQKLHKIVPIICLTLVLIACIRPVFRAQGIYVEEIIASDSLDNDGRPLENVDVFHPDVARIYCFAKIPALSNEILHARWYYENDLIGTTENIVSSQGEISWFLNQPVDQSSFPEGRYRCEMIYRDVELEGISFEVRTR